jgi:hypothetical protein
MVLTRATKTARRGATLVELVVASGILVVLTGAALSVFVIGERGRDAALRRETDRRLDDAIALLRREFSTAVHVSDVQDDTITLIVSDVDGDGIDDSVRYDWSGTVGDTLMRTDVRGAAPLGPPLSECLFTVVDAVTDLDPVQVYDAGRVVFAGSPPDAAGPMLTIAATSAAGQVSIVLLPSNIASWRVDGVRLFAQRGIDAGGTLNVELRNVVAMMPGSTVLAATAVPASSLPTTAGWIDVPFAAASLPPSTTSVAVVLWSSSVTGAARVRRCQAAVLPPTDILWTGTLGLWIAATGDLAFELYGSMTMPESLGTKDVVRGVVVRLLPSDARGSARTEAIATIAPPELVGGAP